jgi:hypothetical protein
VKLPSYFQRGKNFTTEKPTSSRNPRFVIAEVSQREVECGRNGIANKKGQLHSSFSPVIMNRTKTIKRALT